MTGATLFPDYCAAVFQAALERIDKRYNLTNDRTCPKCCGPARPDEQLNAQEVGSATWGRCDACDKVWKCGLFPRTKKSNIL